MAFTQDITKYKPNKYYDGRPVSKNQFECWMVEILYNNANFDPTIFNAWYYDKVKTDALEHILREDIITPRRRRGKYRRLRGISASDRRPDYISSITRFGGLHFGTDLGFHRKIRDAPRGKAWGTAANFVLVLHLDASFHDDPDEMTWCGKEYSTWGYRNLLAAAHALMEEAEERGDMVTVLATPRRWERDFEKYWTSEGLVKRKGDEVIKYEEYDRSGKPVKISYGGPIGIRNDIPGVARKEEYAFYLDPTRALNNRWIGPTRPSGDPSAWYDAVLVDMASGSWAEVGCVTPALWINSTDYEDIKDFLLRFPPLGHHPYEDCGIARVGPKYALRYITSMWDTFNRSKRGQIVWLGSAINPQMINDSWKEIEFLNEFADVWYFDASGKGDKSKYFFDPQYAPKKKRGNQETNEPLLMRGTTRLLNYVYIDDAGDITKAVLKALGGGQYEK